MRTEFGNSKAIWGLDSGFQSNMGTEFGILKQYGGGIREF